MTITANAHRKLRLSALLLTLAACVAETPYKTYYGDLRQDMPLVIVQWVSFIRVEMLNRYHDTSRFIEVDGIPVTNSDQNRLIQITAGFHDIKVYFSWGLGSQRGLASALVEHSKNRGNISKTLRLNAPSGEFYLVMAVPGVRWQSTEHRQLVVCGLLGGEWWEFWDLF